MSFFDVIKLNAKLKTIKSEMPKKDGPRGAIWATGLHKVFVDDKPSTVYVPQYTIQETFNDLNTTLKREGRIPIGFDHIDEKLLKQYPLLAKINLEDVGSIYRIGTDGDKIYSLESELSNDVVKNLHEKGELPSWSIMGKFKSQPCPDGRADHIAVKTIINRPDVVEQGGCEVCTTSTEPGEILITSKKSKPEMEDDEMVEKEEKQEDNEMDEEGEPTKEESSEAVEDKSNESEEEKQDNDESVNEEEESAEEESEDDKSDELKSRMDKLERENKELKELIEGKKPVKAKQSEDKDETVEQLIKAGKATPAQREPLMKLSASNPEAFKEYAKTLGQSVDMTVKSKFAGENKDKEEKEEKDLSVNEVAEAMGRPDLMREA